MTQLAVQQVDLASLMIECSHLPERECGELARRLFNDTFLDTARRGVRKTHDGHDVYIFPDRLKHCFYEKETRTCIDRIRLQRLAWILPMLQGRVSRSECWEADEIDCTRRMYLTFDHG